MASSIRFPKRRAAEARQQGKTVLVCGFLGDTANPQRNRSEVTAILGHATADALFALVCTIQQGVPPVEAFGRFNWALAAERDRQLSPMGDTEAAT